jgi:hypothetical protein
MQRQCFRCSNPIEEQIAFCPACGAPQIRVSKPADSLPETQPGPEPTQDPFAAISDISAIQVNKSGIAWKSFARTAAPLAALTGLFTVPLPPVGMFIILPASVILAIYIYCRHHPAPVRGGEGARLGALTGLLSSFFFAVFFLVTAYLNQAKYREIIVNKVHEIAAQNPDPQAQQMLQWFTTPHGIMTFTAMFLVTVLVFCLIISAGIGALAVAYGKVGNRSRS